MFQIEHERVGPGMVLIHVRGRLMLGVESHQVEQLVGRLLSEGERDFVFDLEGLTHIDSTGIGRFIASYNLILQVEGATLRMAAAAGAVRAAFRVTKLDTVFPFFPDVDSARTAVI
jgi:anti-sigma B factor antagonist